MNDNSGISYCGKRSRLWMWLFCGALLFGGVLGFWKGLSHDKISDLASIVGGMVMLSLCLTKLPIIKPLKPTLAILAVSVLVCGAVDLMLADQGFRAYVGHQIAATLYRFKSIFVGMGFGAALSSLFYGHWTSALMAAQQSHRSKAAHDKSD